jgi:aspartyl/asparaginyl beta-hydroxylase (cupin superfamily)
METFLTTHWKTFKDEGTINMIKGRISHTNKREDINSSGWVRGWTNNPGWLNYGLIDNSKFLKRNCKTCPKTSQLLKNIGNEYPILKAGFSWLAPAVEIPTHIGDGKIYRDLAIVYHVGLDVVSDMCELVVRNETKMVHNVLQNETFFHKNGEILSFDDTYQHSAKNNSSKDILILYIKCRTYKM